MAEPGGTDQEIAAGLPFWVMLWIAGADNEVELAEVAVFQKMLERRSWCRSAIAQRLLPETQKAYPALWQSFTGKKLQRALRPIERALFGAARLTPAADFELFKEDLDKIAAAIARATSGFLGLGAIGAEEQVALQELRELFRRVRLGQPAPSSALPTPAPAGASDTAVDMKPISAAPEGPSRWTRGRIRLHCVEVVEETHDVKTFRFIGEPRVQFVYQPGQFITLDLTIDGKPVKRSYSISSSPTRPSALEITVKRVPGGLVSNWLHDNVQEGFRVNVSGPNGKFSCMPAPPPRMLLLSAGSGITPAMAMARALFDERHDCDIVFLHSARSLDDVPFLGELSAMEKRWKRFRVQLVLTRPAPEVPWKGPKGRLAPGMVLDLVPGYRQRTIFACGPTPFMESARELMRGLGFPLENFFMESFGGARGAEEAKAKKPGSIAELLPSPVQGKQPTIPPGSMRVGPSGMKPPTLPPGMLRAPSFAPGAARPGQAAGAQAAAPKLPKVVFAKSGREVAHDGATPLLELAERMGVTIPSACRAGVCGTCKVALTSGDVKMECSDGLSSADKAARRVLTCVGIPVGPVVVDV